MAEPDTPEGDELEKLVNWVDAYVDAKDNEIIRQRKSSSEIGVDLDDL